jgi:hypothetical protein
MRINGPKAINLQESDMIRYDERAHASFHNTRYRVERAELHQALLKVLGRRKAAGGFLKVPKRVRIIQLLIVTAQ